MNSIDTTLDPIAILVDVLNLGGVLVVFQQEFLPLDAQIAQLVVRGSLDPVQPISR